VFAVAALLLAVRDVRRRGIPRTAT
jgi:hypothetical protein